MTRVIVLMLSAALLGAAPAKPKTTKTSTSHKVEPNRSTHSSVYRSTRGKRRGRTAHAAPSYQLHPDPERYQQIQQALAERGYFKGEVNGQWNDDSIDALKRFQTDQKLDADGKLDALTLTGLGLGPKHDGSTAATVPLSAAASQSSEPGSTPDPGSTPPQSPEHPE